MADDSDDQARRRSAIRKLINDKLDEYFELEPDKPFTDDITGEAGAACVWLVDILDENVL